MKTKTSSMSVAWMDQTFHGRIQTFTFKSYKPHLSYVTMAVLLENAKKLKSENIYV